jgi:pimeloyl-ACP methyl ester carboxylesterase
VTVRRWGAAAAILVVGVLVVGAPTAAADHQAGHEPPPGPAKVAFAPDFPALTDAEWGFALGGFGGIERGAPVTRTPVIFVHGNNVDHADWYPVRDDFRAAGWTDQEMWALSYNGLGNNNGSSPARANPERDAEHAEMGGDGAARVTANDVNVADLHAFIRAVQDYTGIARVALVGHSLGVTVIRKTLLVHPELRPDLVAVVAIAGGNHGTSLCPPGSEGQVHGCDELARGSAWLDELNGPDGAHETYGPARWLTVYDGTGAGDVAYVGPDYADSPALRGADNRTFPGMDHNGLRLDPDVVAVYRGFLEDTDAAWPRGRPEPLPAAGPGDAPGGAPATPGPNEPTTAGAPADSAGRLPATGGGVGAAALATLLAAVSAPRRRRCAPNSPR